MVRYGWLTCGCLFVLGLATALPPTIAQEAPPQEASTGTEDAGTAQAGSESTTSQDPATTGDEAATGKATIGEVVTDDPQPPVQETVDPAAALAEYQRLAAAFQTLQAEYQDKATKVAQAREDASKLAELPRLRREANAVALRMNEELPALIAAAMTAYRAQPAPDEGLTKAVIGMMVYMADEHEADPAFVRDVLDLCVEMARKGSPREWLATAAGSTRLDPLDQDIMLEGLLRYDETLADDLPRVEIQTAKGKIVVELFEDQAPNTVSNFISLVRKGFYDGLTFHRVLEGFMAQGGDPTGDGTGGPGYTIACECYQLGHRNHFVGSLAMAHAGKDTGGSQFYLTLGRPTHLDGRHTVFGRVIEGQDVVEALQKRSPDDPNAPPADTIVRMTVIRARDHAYEPITSLTGQEPATPAPGTATEGAGEGEGEGDTGEGGADEGSTDEPPVDDGTPESGDGGGTDGGGTDGGGTDGGGTTESTGDGNL